MQLVRPEGTLRPRRLAVSEPQVVRPARPEATGPRARARSCPSVPRGEAQCPPEPLGRRAVLPAQGSPRCSGLRHGSHEQQSDGEIEASSSVEDSNGCNSYNGGDEGHWQQWPEEVPWRSAPATVKAAKRTEKVAAKKVDKVVQEKGSELTSRLVDTAGHSVSRRRGERPDEAFTAGRSVGRIQEQSHQKNGRPQEENNGRPQEEKSYCWHDHSTQEEVRKTQVHGASSESALHDWSSSTSPERDAERRTHEEHK